MSRRKEVFDKKKKKTGSGVGVRARLRAEASIGPPVSWKIGEGIQT